MDEAEKERKVVKVEIKKESKEKILRVWQRESDGTSMSLEMKKKLSKLVRRSSLDIGDPSWQYKHQTSLINAGVKVRRRKSCEDIIFDVAD